MILRWYGFWVRIAYALRLRRGANRLQRWLKGEPKAPRKALPLFSAVEDVDRYARKQRYKWRTDASRVGGILLPLDWISDPEVFQARLEQPSPSGDGDGDCDDRHFWAAHCYARIEGVQNVMLCSTGFAGGGHTTCAFLLNGQWYHDNYGLSPIDDPNDIPQIVARRHTPEGKKVRVIFYVFEDLELNAITICPARYRER
jgi:hypothetical protein